MFNNSKFYNNYNNNNNNNYLINNSKNYLKLERTFLKDRKNCIFLLFLFFFLSKIINTCGHPEDEHYAKKMCNNCYHKYGRNKKPWNCKHDKLYACGLC
jgi:hypothetical protein